MRAVANRKRKKVRKELFPTKLVKIELLLFHSDVSYIINENSTARQISCRVKKTLIDLLVQKINNLVLALSKKDI